MSQIDQIDDYIEPQLIIQAKAKEIAELTLRKDYAAAFEANRSLQAASQKLGNWLWKNMDERV